MSGHLPRRKPFESILLQRIHHISACNSYRQRYPTESDAAFVDRKAAELDAKFQELGPHSVIAFVAEPVVGAALGCMPCVPGYLSKMKQVCEQYGALLILDEVMSGMGRTGTLHAWQAHGVVPDIQTIGKGLGGGFQSIAGVLVGEKVCSALDKGTGNFVHGHTYQSHPVACAAALAVQRFIRQQNLVSNVAIQGEYLGSQLKEKLARYPIVGDIRGSGLFWGIEFVKNRETMEPFEPKVGMAKRVQDEGMLNFELAVYIGQGSADGWKGDHIIISPAFTVTSSDIDFIVNAVQGMVKTVSGQLKLE